MDQLAASLTNRNSDDDRSRLARHVRLRFEKMRISEVDLGTVMRWLDDMKAGKARVIDRSRPRASPRSCLARPCART